MDTGAHHGMRGAPTSQIGRWAVGLATAAFAGVVISIVGFATGFMESASSFSDNWALTVWGTAILVAGAAAAIAGAYAILRRHDHGWSVLLATFVGAVALAMMVNEVVQGLTG